MVAEETFLDFSTLTIPGMRPNPASIFKQPKGARRLNAAASAPTLPALPPRDATPTAAPTEDEV